MGVTQYSSENKTHSAEFEEGSKTLNELHTQPTATPMIHKDRNQKQSISRVKVKKIRLEPNQGDSSSDAQRIQNAMKHLHQSGWYWGSVTASEAKQLLTEAVDGSFLVRDSSNPGYLLTLSVKTTLGPTHLRIETSNGQFGFDSVVMARPHLRQFKGAVDLVQYYTLAYRRQVAHRSLTPDPEAQSAAESVLQLQLTKPLHKTVSSLQHACRIVINQHSRNHQDLPLPERLKGFLRDYPFVL